MSLAATIVASRKAASREAEEAEKREALENRFIAKTIMRARKAGEVPFPSNEIESLTEISTRVVAANFTLYPELEGVADEKVCEEIVKATSRELDVTVTARNIEHEFYWEDKCKLEKHMENVKKEQHGNSYKQAYIEKYVERLLEEFNSEKATDELKKKLDAARYEVFSLTIQQLQHLDITVVFEYLPNLAFLTLTYGAKHVGMAYERPLFGMKMSDAKLLRDCLRKTQSLCYLALPGNLIDDDLVSILVKGLMLNKTITQLDFSHNKISHPGARKIAKYLL